jgi:hypothetical protein
MLRLVILTLLACGAIANASPRSDPTIGRAVFTGATVPSATSLGLNPAALGLGYKTELYVGLASVLEQFGVDRKLIDLDTGTLVDGPSVSDAEAGAGAMIAMIWHPGDRGSIGVELRIPPPELFPNHPALRYHALGSKQTNYVATFGTSLRVISRFYFGASLSHDVTRVRLRYARDTALDAGGADCNGSPCGFENPEAAQTFDVDARSRLVSTENLRVNIGVLVKLWPDAWLGLAYHNTPGFGIQSQLGGDMTVLQAPRDGGERLEGNSTIYVSYPASVDGELRARLLPRVDLHIGGRWEDLSRMTAYDVRAYGSAFRGENVPEWTLRPRGYRDSFALWAGVQQIDREDGFTFGGRIGIETSALPPDRTAPGAVSPTALTLDGGAQWRRNNWILQLSYGAQLFQRVTSGASEYDPRFAVQCADSGFDYTTRACGQLRDGYAIPTAAGDYTRIQHALRLGLRYEFP